MPIDIEDFAQFPRIIAGVKEELLKEDIVVRENEILDTIAKLASDDEYQEIFDLELQDIVYHVTYYMYDERTPDRRFDSLSGAIGSSTIYYQDHTTSSSPNSTSTSLDGCFYDQRTDIITEGTHYETFSSGICGMCDGSNYIFSSGPCVIGCCDTSSSYQILYQPPNGKPVIALDVKGIDTIDDVKDKIVKKDITIPASHLTLYHRGTEVKEGTLYDHGIDRESIITFGRSILGGVKYTCPVCKEKFNCNNGGCICAKCAMASKVLDIKMYTKAGECIPNPMNNLLLPAATLTYNDPANNGKRTTYSGRIMMNKPPVGVCINPELSQREYIARREAIERTKNKDLSNKKSTRQRGATDLTNDSKEEGLVSTKSINPMCGACGVVRVHVTHTNCDKCTRDKYDINSDYNPTRYEKNGILYCYNWTSAGKCKYPVELKVSSSCTNEQREHVLVMLERVSGFLRGRRNSSYLANVEEQNSKLHKIELARMNILNRMDDEG